MSGSLVALLVIAVLLVAVALVGAARWYRASRGVEVIAHSADRFTFRTPVGPASATIGVVDDVGRCFVVETAFRGEPVHTFHVPPALHLARTLVERRVAENIEHRRRPTVR